MDAQGVAQAAGLLAEARRSGKRIAGLPAECRPANEADAHAIQDAVTALLGKPVGAFKAMAPPGGQANRGIIYADTVFASPAGIPAAQVPQCGVEGEVAFIVRRDLPPRPNAYSRAEVDAAVDACAAIEVVTSRFHTPNDVSVMEKMADCINNGAFVYATPFADWRKLDLGKLKVSVTVNGTTIKDQIGGHLTGDPLGIAVVLVNMMREKAGMRAGQFVTCGSFTGINYLQPGDVCRVHFEGLGAAEVTFTR